MRQERPDLRKTNLTSLVAAAGIVGLVAWMAAHTAASDSIYANGHTAARPTVAASAPPAPAHSAAPNVARAG